MATKNAHWQAAFRRRMREAGLKAVTVWLPKEGADRLARYPEKERGEVITRALMLLESQGELTGESRGEDEDTLTVAELFTRLKRVEAILSTITSNSTGVLTGNEPPGPQATPAHEAASEAASITGESTDKSTGEVAVALSETPAGLPPKRVAALIRQAKKLSAQGVSWKEIARRWNAEGVPTRSGIGKWYGSTVAKLSRNE
jgi:Recombinase